MEGLSPQLDWRVLSFTLGICVVTGLLFGIAPAIRSSQLNLTRAERSGSHFGALGRSLLSKSLVVAQVSISVLLLIGAGLFIRSLRNLQQVDVGFNSQNLLLFNIEPGLIGYREARLGELYQRLFARLEAVPGVQAVTASQVRLLAFRCQNKFGVLPGRRSWSRWKGSRRRRFESTDSAGKLSGDYANSFIGGSNIYFSRRRACSQCRSCKSSVRAKVLPERERYWEAIQF